MRHLKKNKKLNKPTDQRLALIKNLTYSLVENNRISTTSTRAKEVKKMVEKLVTISKDNSVHNIRLLMKVINNKKFLKNIMEYGKKYKDRNGGYTRIVKLKNRQGDGASISLIEFV